MTFGGIFIFQGKPYNSFAGRCLHTFLQGVLRPSSQGFSAGFYAGLCPAVLHHPPLGFAACLSKNPVRPCPKDLFTTIQPSLS